MSDRRRGALVGFGGVAEHGHWPGWRDDPRFEVGAVVEPLSAGRERARAALGDAVRIYDDLVACLEAEALDFLDVATPPAHHLPAIEAAAEAGLHVLVEKPLALTSQEAERAETAAREGRAAFAIDGRMIDPPVIQRAQQQLALARRFSGDIGSKN